MKLEMQVEGEPTDVRGLLLCLIALVLFLLILLTRGWHASLWVMAGGFLMGFAHLVYVCHLQVQDGKRKKNTH